MAAGHSTGARVQISRVSSDITRISSPFDGNLTVATRRSLGRQRVGDAQRTGRTITSKGRQAFVIDSRKGLAFSMHPAEISRSSAALAHEVYIRSRQSRTWVSGLTLVGLLLFSACGPAHGQDAKPPDKKASWPAVEKDVPYADGGDQRMLDLYLPDKKGYTTVVFTFGGGWHTGSRKPVTPIGEQLQGLGYGCALLSHRLAPKDKFPAQAEDVAAAFAWVKKNIEARGGDSKQVLDELIRLTKVLQEVVLLAAGYHPADSELGRCTRTTKSNSSTRCVRSSSTGSRRSARARI